MIHHVFANRSNIGDWLSARGIQSLLAPLEVTEHLCDEPFIDETLTALSTLGRDDLIVIGGGGLFMDYFTPFWSGLLRVGERVPFCIWGVGYCDLKREESRPPHSLMESVIANSRLCVVRDELSRQLIAVNSLPAPVPCPSIAAVATPEQGGTALLHAVNRSTAGEETYEAMCAHARSFADRTGRRYLEIKNRIPADSKRTLAASLETYASADLVLSSRLHGCIIALAMGQKVLAVSGDRKIESFMHAAGLDEWVCDLDELDSIPDRLESLPSQQPRRGFLEWARRQNREIAETVRSLVT
jgi:polysaccharide pyruvyl transferase WcaK-like protein